MVEFLRQNIVVGSCCSYNEYFNILLIHTASEVVLVAMKYSSSTEESVTMESFLDAHDTTPVPK
jgi:hypothetical protein